MSANEISDQERIEAEHLSGVLMSPIGTIKSLNEEQTEMWNKFMRPTPPDISLTDYLARLFHFLKLDDIIKTAIIHYKKLLNEQCGVELNECSVHRFALASVVVASKCLLDNQYSFTFYARIGGVSPSELAVLELNLLRLLDWRVFCL